MQDIFLVSQEYLERISDAPEYSQADLDMALGNQEFSEEYREYHNFDLRMFSMEDSTILVKEADMPGDRGRCVWVQEKDSEDETEFLQSLLTGTSSSPDRAIRDNFKCIETGREIDTLKISYITDRMLERGGYPFSEPVPYCPYHEPGKAQRKDFVPDV